MRRREFITALGGAAAAWPLAARAQQPERMRRIGVLMGTAADDPEGQTRHRGVAARRWRNWAGPMAATCGSTARWGAGDADRIRRYAEELVALAPDVILAAAQCERGTVAKGDPQRAHRVRLGHRSGGRWLRRQPRSARRQHHRIYRVRIWYERKMGGAPQTDRARRDASSGHSGSCHNLGDRSVRRNPRRGAAVRGRGEPGRVATAEEIERGIAEFAHGSNGGLIVTAGTLANINRNLIIALAARYRLPAVYSDRPFVIRGGLISYGPDRVDQYRRAAGYVDRILKGEKPADLPVQAPTKYELVINLKTAKALGLEVPPTLLARADEVIE